MFHCIRPSFSGNSAAVVALVLVLAATVGSGLSQGRAAAGAPAAKAGPAPPRAEMPAPGADMPASKATPPTEEEYLSPEAIIKTFVAELGRLGDRKELTSPATLVQQAEASKTCKVQALADPGVKLSAEAVYSRARRGVVILGGLSKGKKRREAQALFATGFAIQKGGIVASNAHVVEAFQDYRAVAAMTADGRVVAIKAVLAADRANDVAVLRIDAEDLPPLPLASGAPVGAAIYCLSHPALDNAETENGFFTFTQGIVSGKFRSRLGGSTPRNVLAITADYARGSSGGPILNEHGAVVGIICQSLSLWDESDRDIQMTWKLARPVGNLLAILQEGTAKSK